MKQVNEQLRCSPFQNWATIDLIDILCTDTYFVSIGSCSTLFSPHTIKNYYLYIVVSGYFSEEQNRRHRFVNSAAPSHSPSRRAKLLPTIFGIQMAFCLIKLKRWPMFFRSFYRLDCSRQLHSCVAKNHREFVGRKRTTDKVEQHQRVLPAAKSDCKSHALFFILVMGLSDKVHRRLFEAEH